MTTIEEEFIEWLENYDLPELTCECGCNNLQGFILTDLYGVQVMDGEFVSLSELESPYIVELRCSNCMRIVLEDQL